MEIEVFTTPGLGDNSYLVVAGDEAALIDPQRDAWRFLDVARAKKASVRYVLETHLHNDYLSGALETRAATQAEIVAPATGGYAFPHRPMAEGDELRIGDYRIVAMETPGHTPEHIAWLLYEGGGQQLAAVFTGGSLLVGSTGRTDLLGDALRDELTRAQYHSVRRLLDLPNNVQVLPTHGAGSFCVATSVDGERTTTVGQERRVNPVALASNETAFAGQQGDLPAYPAYYSRMAPINRVGPPVLARLPSVRALPPDAFEQRLQAPDVWVVDARERHEFAREHIPGSVNVELGDSFGTYVGWVLPFNAPLLLVMPAQWGALDEAVTQLIRIGSEHIEGVLEGGIAAWVASGRAARSYPVADITDLCEALSHNSDVRVLDVRQDTEWEQGHVPGSLHRFVGDLPSAVESLPRDQELWTACSSGFRAAIGASLLDRAGVPVRLVSHSGVEELLRRQCTEQAVDAA